MANVLIRHSIEDYDAWKSAFDAHASTRMEFGSQGYRLFRSSEDPNELVMLFEWDSVENAHRFLEESDLRDVMQEAGVVGEPAIQFIDEIEAKTPEKAPA